ncbi:unnamed protein product [Cochlearia groenlandica]
MQTGNCFRCRQAGHWISDCPQNSKSNNDPIPPEIHCPCGGGVCKIKISNTVENPGRRFYKCPTAHNCRFFKWCDKVTEEDIRFRSAFTIPACPCGSGPCRRVTDGSGRAYFVCCVKKGFGACGYFKWEDDYDVKMPMKCDVVEENDFWVEADMILSDVESSFQAGGGVCVNANLGKECQGSVSVEVDSVFKHCDVAASVSEIHSSTDVNQEGVSMSDPAVIEPVKHRMKSLHCDEAAYCGVSKLIVDATISDYVAAGDGEAEWSFPNLQDLINRYNSEKLRLESVSGKHTQVLSAFVSSYQRLRLLHAKTSHLRTSLLETEKELACCEADTLEYGASCKEVAVEMAESQKRMQETAEQLAKEVESMKQKEFVDMKRRRS